MAPTDRSLLAVVLLGSLVACAAPAVPTRAPSRSVHASPPAAAASSSQAAPDPPTVDVDRDDCARNVRGTLTAERGLLVYRIHGDKSDATPDAPAEPPLVAKGKRASTKPSKPEEPSPLTDADFEERWARSWARGATRLAPSGQRVLGEEGTLGGRFSTLISTTDPARGVAVREREVEGKPHAYELVTIRTDTLTPVVLYAPNARMSLVGRLAGAIIVAVQDKDDDHWLVAVDLTGKELARSRTVKLEQRVALERPAEISAKWTAPRGPNALLLTCERHHLCEVELRGSELTAKDTGLDAGEGLATSRGDAFIERADHTCVALRRGKPLGGPKTVVPCPEDRSSEWDDKLPVAGELAAGIEGETPLCRVRTQVTLPDLPGEADEAKGGAALFVVVEPTQEDQLLTFEVIVRAKRLAVAWARASGMSVSVLRSDMAVALPPGSVAVTPATAEGRAAWRVRVRAPFPEAPSRHCSQGRLVLRAAFGEADEDLGDTAWVNRYHEQGRCE